MHKQNSEERPSLGKDVFVSRPTWVASVFEPGLKTFLTRLKDIGLVARTLGATDYPTKAPLDDVIKIMDRCAGAIILGYPQIEVMTGTVKGTPIPSQLFLPTEWNHIEAGLAYARQLPLLVVHHHGVGRGIFDRGALNCFLFEKDLSSSVWAADPEIDGALRAWRDEVLGFAPTPKVDRSPIYRALEAKSSTLWTVMAYGRHIDDPRPVEANHRESAECAIEELNEFYVRLKLVGSGTLVTIPLGDLKVSYDDRRHRPMLELRS